MKRLKRITMLFCILWAGDDLEIIPLCLPFVHDGDCPCHLDDNFKYSQEAQKNKCASLCILKFEDGKRMLGADYGDCECDIQVCPDGAFVKPGHVLKTYKNGDVVLPSMEMRERMADLTEPDYLYPVSGDPLENLNVRNWEDDNVVEEAAQSLERVLKLTGLQWIYDNGYENEFDLRDRLVKENGVELFVLDGEDIKLPFDLLYGLINTELVGEKKILLIGDVDKVSPVWLDPETKILTKVPWSEMWDAILSYNELMSMSVYECNQLKFLDQ